MEYQERYEALTPSDKSEVRKNLIGAGVFAVFSGIIFTIIAMQVDIRTDDATTYIVLAFGLLFFGIVAFIAIGALRDLKSGQKLLMTGEVTNKEIFQSRNSGRKGKSRPKYMLFFGDKKVYVQHHHYHKVSVGDQIELHYAKYSNKSLAVIYLNKKETNTPEQPKPLSAMDVLRAQKAERDAVFTKEYPLRDDDLKALRRTRNSKVATNLFVLFILTVFVLAFSFASLFNPYFMLAVLLFLGVMGLFLKWAIKCFQKYKKDKKEGIKTAAVSHLKDKHTYNRSGSKSYRITTEYGTFPVQKTEYEELKIGDKVFTFHGKHSNWLIGVRTQG
ncbi:MAG: hypothetical protein RIG77_01155 [Cyclobacteriaceae bacterium]